MNSCRFKPSLLFTISHIHIQRRTPQIFSGNFQWLLMSRPQDIPDTTYTVLRDFLCGIIPEMLWVSKKKLTGHDHKNCVFVSILLSVANHFLLISRPKQKNSARKSVEETICKEFNARTSDTTQNAIQILILISQFVSVLTVITIVFRFRLIKTTS